MNSYFNIGGAGYLKKILSSILLSCISVLLSAYVIITDMTYIERLSSKETCYAVVLSIFSVILALAFFCVMRSLIKEKVFEIVPVVYFLGSIVFTSHITEKPKATALYLVISLFLVIFNILLIVFLVRKIIRKEKTNQSQSGDGSSQSGDGSVC